MYLLSVQMMNFQFWSGSDDMMKDLSNNEFSFFMFHTIIYAVKLQKIPSVGHVTLSSQLQLGSDGAKTCPKLFDNL